MSIYNDKYVSVYRDGLCKILKSFDDDYIFTNDIFLLNISDITKICCVGGYTEFTYMCLFDNINLFTNVKKIIVNPNDDTVSLHKHIKINLPNLESFYSDNLIYKNNVQFDCKCLTRIEICHAELSKIPTVTYPNVLTTLSLQCNNITCCELNCEKLERLYLKGNDITHINVTKCVNLCVLCLDPQILTKILSQNTTLFFSDEESDDEDKDEEYIESKNNTILDIIVSTHDTKQEITTKEFRLKHDKLRDYMLTLKINVSDLSMLNHLECLEISSLQLTMLPILPPNLSQLYCCDNKLTQLPILPDTLCVLLCFNNALTFLPKLPNDLHMLVCDHNELLLLPYLPQQLEDLDCSNNNLIKLPDMIVNLKHLISVIYTGNSNIVISTSQKKFLEQFEDY